MSETYFKRQILAEFTDSERLEHAFPRRYQQLAEACEAKLGWLLFLPLQESDEYHFRCVHVPATDEQRDFDELVLGLTKILIDSLNERQLNALIPQDQQTSVKGSISLLEAALTACGVADGSEHIGFLIQLQRLRSSGSAHRKGKEYRRIARDFGMESQNLRAVFTEILRKSLVLMDYLTEVVNSGELVQGSANQESEGTI